MAICKTIRIKRVGWTRKEFRESRGGKRGIHNCYGGVVVGFFSCFGFFGFFGFFVVVLGFDVTKLFRWKKVNELVGEKKRADPLFFLFVFF